MKPTPNDTKGKQFLTAIYMTVLFAIGACIPFLLFGFSEKLCSSAVRWTQVCGTLIYIAAWVFVVVFIVVSILSMLDWMRSTTERHAKRQPRDRSGHSGRHAHA